MAESRLADHAFTAELDQLSPRASWESKGIIPGGVNTPGHVIHYLREIRDYGWNQLIASAVVSGGYGAAAALCAQARAECLLREQSAPQLPSAEKHFSNYMKFWLLEARIDRLHYSVKHDALACGAVGGE